MLTQSQYRISKLEDEFSKPVESIMRCEDFKSNFARRLSNRYNSKSPIPSPKPEPMLKLCLPDNKEQNVPENVLGSIEPASQLSKKCNKEQNGEVVKPPDKLPPKKSDFHSTEVNALNMEVETLRWQLAQTETNRQMHIALLRQIVTFLNKVKEHIQVRNVEKNETLSPNLLSKSLNLADLPRSRSVVHVNKNLEYSLTPAKKIQTRKISKSISNVTRYKDCNGVWISSKLSLASETDNTQKITEEMKRLITLANTVLSTKLPDLTCTCNENINEINNINSTNKLDKQEKPKTNELHTAYKENQHNIDIKNVSNTTINDYEEVTSFNETKEKHINNINAQPPIMKYGLDSMNIKLHDNNFNNNSLFVNNVSDSNIVNTHKISIEKRNDYNCNFIEDESGFSSMSSFQEIGIPIISIIPPSPCKEMGYLEDIPDVLNVSEKWKTDTIELEKQTVKVFWV